MRSSVQYGFHNVLFHGLQIFEDSPIEHIVVIETLACEDIAEDFAQVGVFGLVVKPKRTDVVEIRSKPPRQTLTQIFRTGCLFLL